MAFEFIRRPGEDSQLEPALYVVATPIGNLADMTLRGLQVLEAAALVLAEDTRNTRRLLDHFGLSARTESCHEHNEKDRVPQLLRSLREGRAVALVSDAGTPLISDPGYLLVRAVRDAGFPVIPVPGVCAVTAALSVSGLPCHEFAFIGFLPARQAARRARLAELSGEPRTLVLYEAGRRIPDLLADLVAVMGASRDVVLVRELTKVHEEVCSGSAEYLSGCAQAEELELRGEFVVLIGRAEQEQAAGLAEARRIRDLLATEMSASQAARMAARISGVERKALYQDGLTDP